MFYLIFPFGDPPLESTGEDVKLHVFFRTPGSAIPRYQTESMQH